MAGSKSESPTRRGLKADPWQRLRSRVLVMIGGGEASGGQWHDDLEPAA